MDVSSIWSGIQNVADGARETIMSALPISPFTAYINQIEKYEWLAYINWLIPIDQFIAIGEGWLMAVGIFYLYSIVLRWIKAIE